MLIKATMLPNTLFTYKIVNPIGLVALPCLLQTQSVAEVITMVTDHELV